MHNTAAVSKETWQSRDTVTIQTHSYSLLSLFLSFRLAAPRLRRTYSTFSHSEIHAIFFPLDFFNLCFQPPTLVIIQSKQSSLSLHLQHNYYTQCSLHTNNSLILSMQIYIFSRLTSWKFVWISSVKLDRFHTAISTHFSANYNVLKELMQILRVNLWKCDNLRCGKKCYQNNQTLNGTTV